MNKTVSPNPKTLPTNWHHLNAQDKVLGRIATEASKILIGKHRADFTPNQYLGDKVVIVNASKIYVSGNKLTDKVYYRHSSYPGGLKSETLGRLMERRPTEALRKAIKGMLPKNKLQKVRMANLYIYEGEEHPHAANIKDKN